MPSVFVTERSALGAGVSVSVAALFPGTGSGVLARALIVAVLTRLPVAIGLRVATTVYVRLPPTGSVTDVLRLPVPLAAGQVAPPAPAQVQAALVTIAGRVSTSGRPRDRVRAGVRRHDRVRRRSPGDVRRGGVGLRDREVGARRGAQRGDGDRRPVLVGGREGDRRARTVAPVRAQGPRRRDVARLPSGLGPAPLGEVRVGDGHRVAVLASGVARRRRRRHRP